MFNILQKFKTKFIKKRKISTILNYISDIDIGEDLVTIKLNKDILITSDQNIILSSNQNIVLKSKILHLNPEIDVSNNIKEHGMNKVINLILEKNKEKHSFIEIDKEIV